MKNPRILVINTGSTSTKIAVFEAKSLLWQEKIEHDTGTLEQMQDFDNQVFYRQTLIRDLLEKNGFEPTGLDMIMSRGGLLRPVASGVYRVNDKMLHDLRHAPRQHASNLAAVIAYQLSEDKIPVYIADPVVVDEMQEIARYAGHKLFQRISIFHALNHKAVARNFARNQHAKYEELNLIVAHLGGGISVGAHQKGRVIDVNQALDGEGPFSPERSGTLPAGDLVKLCFSGRYSQTEIQKMIVGNGGLVSYLNTNNIRKIENNLTPDKKQILSAMAYQIAKSIGEMSVVLKGNVDAILLTGGVAHSQFITGEIKKYINFIAPVYIYPGEDEMQALAFNAFLLWNNELKAKTY